MAGGGDEGDDEPGKAEMDDDEKNALVFQRRPRVIDVFLFKLKWNQMGIKTNENGAKGFKGTNTESQWLLR